MFPAKVWKYELDIDRPTWIEQNYKIYLIEKNITRRRTAGKVNLSWKQKRGTLKKSHLGAVLGAAPSYLECWGLIYFSHNKKKWKEDELKPPGGTVQGVQ